MAEYYGDQNNLLGRRPAIGAGEAHRPVRWWLFLIVLLIYGIAIYLMTWIGSQRGTF